MKGKRFYRPPQVEVVIIDNAISILMTTDDTPPVIPGPGSVSGQTKEDDGFSKSSELEDSNLKENPFAR